MEAFTWTLMSISWDQGMNWGTRIAQWVKHTIDPLEVRWYMQKKGALFIDKWIDSYNNYDPSKWGDNSVLMAEKLARKFPDLIHVFEHHCAFYPHGLVLYNQNYKWSHSYGLHIYKTGHIPELQKINFETVRNINNTIGAVFRYILFGSKELCSS